MNYEAVYRTAPATPGLLNMILFKWIYFQSKIMDFTMTVSLT